MGPLGSAWATLVCRYLTAVGLVLAAWPHLAPSLRGLDGAVFDRGALGRMFAIGAPIGGQYLLEFAVFGTTGLLMGWLGTDAMAAHQVALNLASVTFMVPLGVSAAAAIRVGHAVGAGDPLAMRRAAAAALAIGVGFMSLTALAMLLAPYPLARAYTPEAAVLATAVMLLPLAGLFQVFDGIQVVAVGILRGTGDTRAPMVINVLGFWLLGVPVSWYLGIHTSMGPRGLWWGFVAGLAAVAVLLLARVRYRLRMHIARTVVDERGSVRAGALPDVA
jgi:MATE family multidrug resistance protein